MIHRLTILLSVLVLFTGEKLTGADYGMASLTPTGKFANGVFPATAPNSGGWGLTPAFTKLKFDNATTLTAAPRTNLFYAGSRSGGVQSFVINASTSTKKFVLDLSSKIELVADGGLLGMAFHPEYGMTSSPNREFVYLFYTAKGIPNPFLRLVRYRIPPATGVAVPASEEILINMRLRGLLHRGGGLTFGNDGFLYLSVGDQNDLSVSQNLSTSLEGGVLRIDVDKNPAKSHPPLRSYPLGDPNEYTQGYWIPNDNPFLDPTGSTFEEYFSIGHRNPHRLTNDPVTGRLWIGEVGSTRREEVNAIQAGDNHGWPFFEGTVAGDQAAPEVIPGNVVGPVAEFGREDAQAIIGGYVYRGSEHPYLNGKYLCADYRLPHVFAISWDGSGVAAVEKLVDNAPTNLVTMGQDLNGEVYFCRLGGQQRIYKLEQNQQSAEPPILLSQTGVFELSPTTGNFQGMELNANAEFIPYDVNNPLWSDGAVKQRWIAVPNSGIADTPGEKIGFHETGPWDFPNGTVIVKHFEMPVDERDASVLRRLETRFLIHGDDGEIYGLTYRWRPDGTEADLLTDGLDEEIDVTTTNGGNRKLLWQYPSRGSCLTCHNDQAGEVLGLRTEQLNGPLVFPGGVEDNQLRTWNHLQLFEPLLDEASIGGMPRGAKLDRAEASLGHRVKSYLAANCAFCHQPTTGNLSQFDARLKTPFPFQGLLNTIPSNDLGIAGSRLLVSGDPGLSTIYQRLHTEGPEKMPPLGRNVVDAEFVNVLGSWIENLPASHPEKGLKADYYDGNQFQQYVMSRVDSQINFDWGSSGPDTAVGNDLFSVRWSGYLNPEVTGAYTFRVVSDNGFRLWIDGVLVIDAWDPEGGSHGFINETGSLTLEADRPVTFKAEFYEDFQGAQVRLFWSAPGLLERIIPENAFVQSMPVLAAPVATEDVANVVRDGEVTLMPLVNDVFTNGNLDYSSFELVSPPQFGSVTYEPWSGRLTYMHDGSQNHSADVLTYRISDTFGQVSSVTGILVSILNQPPVTEDDQLNVAFGSSEMLAVLANDSDSDDGISPQSLKVVANPSWGSVVVNTSGTVTYTHHGGVSNTDQFTYRVRDFAGAWSNLATVAVSIASPVNGSITVDGNLADWDASHLVASDPQEPENPSGFADLLGMYLTHDADEFFLAYLNEGPISLTWGWTIFFDTDQNTQTGYLAGPLGSEYMLRGAEMFQYAGTGTNWEWTSKGTMTHSVLGNVAEFRFPQSWLGNATDFNYFFFGDNSSYAGGSDGDLVPDSGFLTYAMSNRFQVDGVLNEWTESDFRVSDPDDVIATGDQIDLTRLSIGDDATRFFVAYENEAAVDLGEGAMLFFDTDGSASSGYPLWGMGADALIRGNEIYVHNGNAGTWSWGFVGIAPHVRNGTVTEISVPKSWLGFPSFLKVIFFGVNTAFGVPDQPEVIPNNPSNGPLLYGAVPDGIVIDGHFADWPSASIVNDENDPFGQGDPLDLLSMRWLVDQGNVFLGYENDGPVDLNAGWMVFLDIDRSLASGYRLYNSGADVMVRGNEVYEYQGSGEDWSWLLKGTMVSGFAANRVEFSFPQTWIGNASDFDFIFFGDNSSSGGSMIETIPDQPEIPGSYGP